MTDRFTNPRPGDFAIFKSKSVFQVSLLPAKGEQVNRGDKQYVRTVPGVFFLACAPAISKMKYDWEKKISLAVKINEVGKVLMGLKGKGEVKLYHDPDKDTDREGTRPKALTFQVSGGRLFVNASAKVNGEWQKVDGVPIEPDEALILSTLLSNAAGRLISW